MPKKFSIQDIAHEIPAGGRVLVHAGPSESASFRDALRDAADALSGVTFTGLFLPGVNDFDHSTLGAGARQEGLFVQPALRAGFEAGRVIHLPLHYSDFPPQLAARPVDLAVLHLPPARNGAFSCGLAADVAEGVRRYARRVAVLVNPALPSTGGGIAVREEDVDLVAEVEEAPALFPSPPDDPVAARIGAHAATLVEDGDTVQIGIGKLPASLLRALTDRRRLRFHSGMIIDEVADLVAAGAIADPVAGAPAILTGIAVGSGRLHDLAARGEVAFHGVGITHDARRIATIPRFTGFNGAVEVDLLGQVNCEKVRGRQISGIGGAGDFVRGARLAPGGRACVLLQAEAKGISRIVPCLAAGSVSLSRADVDFLVTEHGVAALRHLSLDARAEAIIALAAPEHRAALAEGWRALRAQM